MKFSVSIGGKAGDGIEKSSIILAKSLIKLGFYCFVYREYGSYIKGGHDFSILTFSDRKVNSHEKYLDLILAFDKSSAEKHENELKNGGIIICGEEYKSKNCIFLNYREIIQKLNAPEITKNSAFLGAFFKTFNLPLEPLLEEIRKEIGEINEKVAKISYENFNFSSKKISLPKNSKTGKKLFLDGTSAVGLGSIYYGLDFYFAYPMTPATKLLHFLSSLREKYDIKTFLLENEIAVVNASIGSNFAGAISMVGTSGGGFDLMAETLSLQGMTEVPLVIYLAQRYGPSTGMPTYTSQSDLNSAIYSGHGDFQKVVVAPGDAEEAFEKTVEAFYLSYKYGILSIILSDKHLAESYFTLDSLKKPKIKPSKFIVENPKDYKTYKITKDYVPLRTFPTKFMVKCNSYEHDEFGFTTDKKEIAKIMQEKRIKKFEVLKKEVESKFEMYKVFGRGKNLIISFGSNKGAILDALEDLPNYKYLHITYLSPLPTKIIESESSKASKIYVIECNSSSQFYNLIKPYLKKNAINILKYDGRPFTPEEILENLKR